MSAKVKGPRREQLTDKQWQAVCHCFNTIARVVTEHRRKQVAV